MSLTICENGRTVIVPECDEDEAAEYYAEKAKEYAEKAEASAESAAESLASAQDCADTSCECADVATAQANAAKMYAGQFFGAPRAAITASDMEDTSLIYVYTGSESGYTNGNWYYYDGTAWVSGGIYNSTAFSTDTTLTMSGAAADAKVVGDELTDLKEDIDALGFSVVDGALNVTYTA